MRYLTQDECATVTKVRCFWKMTNSLSSLLKLIRARKFILDRMEWCLLKEDRLPDVAFKVSSYHRQHKGLMIPFNSEI